MFIILINFVFPSNFTICVLNVIHKGDLFSFDLLCYVFFMSPPKILKPLQKSITRQISKKILVKESVECIYYLNIKINIHSLRNIIKIIYNLVSYFSHPVYVENINVSRCIVRYSFIFFDV